MTVTSVNRAAAAPPSRPIVRANYDTVLDAAFALGKKPTVNRMRLGVVRGLPIDALHLPCTGKTKKPVRMCITAGVHGNEQGGPEAARRLAEWFSENPSLRQRAEVFIVPCLNPDGFRAKSRYTQDASGRLKLDLNRVANRPDLAPEMAILRQFAQTQGPFDLAVDLHASFATNVLPDFVDIEGPFAIGCADESDAFAKAALRRVRSEVPLASGYLSSRGAAYSPRALGLYASTNRGTVKSLMRELGTPLAFTIEASQFSSFDAQASHTTAIAQALITERLSRAPSR